MTRSLLTIVFVVVTASLRAETESTHKSSPEVPVAIDTDRLIFLKVHDGDRIREQDKTPEEYEAYNEVLLHARRVSPEKLDAAARRGLVLADLVKPIRSDYQFLPVHFEGRLIRAKRLEPTKRLAENKIPNLFECWITPDGSNNMLCLLVTELPEGLEPHTHYPVAKSVSFSAYSFKLMMYDSSESDPRDKSRNVVRRAPLLMGRSFSLKPEPSVDAGKSWRETFAPTLVAVACTVGAVLLLLTWFFRRGDRAIRRELEWKRSHNPFENEETPSSGV